MEVGLLLIFWYGVLHAFGPDHLTAIADFSIGKRPRQTFLITLLFALGHGLTLYFFAKLLAQFPILAQYSDVGDLVSASVIMLMGCYLLYLALSERLFLWFHAHHEASAHSSHLHLGTDKLHHHQMVKPGALPALSLGVLMGIGGVRGMLVTLGLVGQQEIGLSVVGVFALGVMVVFMVFGVLLLGVNRFLLGSPRRIKGVFSLLGVTSIVVGGRILWG